MKNILIVNLSFLFISLSLMAFESNTNRIFEIVYIQTKLDTDHDGKLDLIYTQITRPSSTQKLASLFFISPYTLGTNAAKMHEVDMDFLPQDSNPSLEAINGNFKEIKFPLKIERKKRKYEYAQVSSHSLGTGYSTGCPTVGDQNEALAAKSVIDWLGGRAKAFDGDGNEVKADWANGNVGMQGISYNGTLPVMVASTGVEGLKAIVPIAAISSWYDYYRANGSVVNPGGYIGEDADVLGYAIVKKKSCENEMSLLTKNMGREHGDFSKFWQDRDYVKFAKNFKAATFFIHGQNDWNVKQRHPVRLWHALEQIVPTRIFFHKGGHGSTSSYQVPDKINDWFDHFLYGAENGITSGEQVEVELANGKLVKQFHWPSEETRKERFYFSSLGTLELKLDNESRSSIKDVGNKIRIEDLAKKPDVKNNQRLIFKMDKLEKDTLISGTAKIFLNVSVLNRQAANISVALIEYQKNGSISIITRGWADPQNYKSLEKGELLDPSQTYHFSFELEPKQYLAKKGSQLAVLLTATDKDYTLRPKEGTEINFQFDGQSYIDLNLDY